MHLSQAQGADPINQGICCVRVPLAPHRAPRQAMETKVQVSYPSNASAWDTGPPWNDPRFTSEQLPRRLKEGYLPRVPLSLLPNRIRPVGRRRQSPSGHNGRGKFKSASTGTSSPQSTCSPSVPQAGTRMNGSKSRYSIDGDANGNVGQESRMQLSSILVDPHTKTYHLEVIQHPLKTAEFGSANTLSRLPLTPPVVVQLTVRDSAGDSVFPEAEIPFLIAHLSLFTGDGSQPSDVGSSPGGTIQRQLYGNLVAEPQKLRDMNGKQCLLFIFSDVSIRWRGQYQLGISLMRLSSVDSGGVMSITGNGIAIAQARTKPFDVVAHSDYVAAPMTSLTQCLVRQGVRMFPTSGPH